MNMVGKSFSRLTHFVSVVYVCVLQYCVLHSCPLYGDSSVVQFWWVLQLHQEIRIIMHMATLISWMISPTVLPFEPRTSETLPCLFRKIEKACFLWLPDQGRVKLASWFSTLCGRVCMFVVFVLQQTLTFLQLMDIVHDKESCKLWS